MNLDSTKHLELIQSVITRLAGNSFLIKGWSVTLVSVLCSFAAKEANVRFAILALLPALSFWMLDGYYLWQERLFRALYRAVQSQIVNPSSSPNIAAFSMDTKQVEGESSSWFQALSSTAILALHLPVLATVIAVILYSART